MTLIPTRLPYAAEAATPTAPVLSCTGLHKTFGKLVAVDAGLGMAALGGTMLPLDLFPPTVRAFAHLTPHAWAVDGFAVLVRHDGGVSDVLTQVGVLLAMAAALLAAAAWRLRRAITA